MQSRGAGEENGVEPQSRTGLGSQASAAAATWGGTNRGRETHTRVHVHTSAHIVLGFQKQNSDIRGETPPQGTAFTPSSPAPDAPRAHSGPLSS